MAVDAPRPHAEVVVEAVERQDGLRFGLRFERLVDERRRFSNGRYVGRFDDLETGRRDGRVAASVAHHDRDVPEVERVRR